MAPTVTHTVEAIDHALRLKPLLIDDAAWLYADAYLPPGPNPDRATRFRPIDPNDPDHVPGSTWAIGLPTDLVRERYQRSAELVGLALREAARGATIAAGRPIGANVSDRAPLGPAYAIAVDRAGKLLIIVSALAHTAPDRARAAAWSSAGHLVQAHACLRKCLTNVDGSPEPVALRRCRNCREPHIEPDRTDRAECPACRTWRRKKGTPRPLRRNAEAYEAQTRRRERGETHAMEDGGVANGTYRDGKWIRH